MFLADRNIKGECPVCHAKDQYGDNCEVCGAAYQPTELINPFSVFTGSTPDPETVRAVFLQAVRPALLPVPEGVAEHARAACSRKWSTRCRNGWARTAKSWPTGTSRATRPTSASRFPTRRASSSTSGWTRRSATWPSLKNYFGKKGIDYEAFLNDPATEQVHFIGKDIVSFHLLFWPAMLNFSGHPIIDKLKVNVHGHLTVNNEKMSKSRGTGISPLRYLELNMNPEWLRYYIAFKLNCKVEDLDFTGEDFVARVNSDLIGKYVNIASRCAGFIAKKFDGKLAADAVADSAQAWIARALNGERRRAPGQHRRQLRERANSARRCARSWRSPTSPTSTSTRTSRGSWPRTRARLAELHDVCTTALILFRQLTIMLSPVLPHVAARVREFLGDDALSLGRHAGRRASATAMLGRTIGAYSHLMQRVDAKMVEDLFDKPAAAPCRRRASRRRSRRAGRRAPSRRHRRTGARNLDRRLHQDRPAHREDRQLRTRRRLEQAAAPDAGRGRRPPP